MKQRVLWGTIAVVATVHVVLVLAVWWMLHPVTVSEIPTAPTSEARPTTPPPVSVQRLAETFSSAAFRSMITFDYAALNELVKHAAAWPEVAYLSVEDAQGKVIAHTDPARIGQPWNAAAAREVAAARGMNQEVIAAIAGPDTAGKPGTRIGQVRLGYVADDVKSAATAPVSSPATARVPLGPFSFAVVLAGAALAGIPVGFGLVTLSGSGSAPSDAPIAEVKKIRNLRQARWAIGHWMKETELAHSQLAAQRTEVERLRDDIHKRTDQLVELDAQREQLLSEGERWVEERDRLTAQLEEQQREMDRARAAGHEKAASGETPRLERALLDAEAADLRDEVVALRSALARHPMVCHELLDQELRQHQHRVIAYVSHAIRSSLTNVLGFSRLLLRESEGPLNEAQRTDALSIHQAGHHLLRVVNDLTDLTQAEAGAVEPRDESFDVTAVLRELGANGASALGRDQEAITVADPPALPAVKGNEACLVRMLLALMHPPTPDAADGPVEVSAQADDDCVTILVSHRHAAISAQDLPALFDPFAPIDATGTLQDNGGRVRLALARALATTLGGQIAVDSHEDRGTIFTVALPAVSDVPVLA